MALLIKIRSQKWFHFLLISVWG